MKRQKNLYNQMIKYEKALAEYKCIRKHCRNKKAILQFAMYLNENTLSILHSLYNKQYCFSRYRIFIISEPKYRLIMSENISDKLVNRLVSKYILLPVLENKLIDSNVATRYKKGSGYAFKLMVSCINKLMLSHKKIYVLKIDIKNNS